MKKLYLYILPALTLLFMASCAKDTATTSAPDTPEGKTLIALSQEGSALMRAGLTRAGFSSATKVVVRIQARNGETSDYRYAQSVMTAGTAVTNDVHNQFDNNLGAHSDLTYNTGQDRYWDDAYGRTSRLSVYGVAIPDNNGALPDDILDQTVATTLTAGWYTISGAEKTQISWNIGDKQDATTHATKDIAYSNNIRTDETTYKGRYVQTYNTTSGNWDKSMQLGYLRWEPKTNTAGETTGRFDQGHLVFKHALTWITITLTEGEGFNHDSDADFQWTNKPAGCVQSLTLKGFPTSGTLDISNGSWSGPSSPDITQMYEATASNTTRTLHAYVLPGTNLYDDNTNVFTFEIDQVKYYVTGRQMAEAIRAGSGAPSDFTTTQPGTHYTIKLELGKTKVDHITAAIVDWEHVNSNDITPSNTDLTFTFEDRGEKYEGDAVDKFDIYRKNVNTGAFITGSTAANYEWETGYETTPATKTFSTDHWTTNWSWPDNKTFTHFRVVGKGESTGANAITIQGNASPAAYFTVNSGIGKDYVWGAPFVDVDAGYKYKYDETNGFAKNGDTYQIHKGIPATNSPINMLIFHVLSQIKVEVTTSTGTDKVELQKNSGATDADKTKVEILNILPDGQVLLGTGLVATTGTERSDATMGNHAFTAESGENPAKVVLSCGIVPQALSYSDGTIGLRITTPDGNQYTISDLSTVIATVTANNIANPYTESSTAGYYTIGKWYPSYTYTYKVKIVKTGVAYITAAVLPWENVTSDLGTIDLEN